MGIRTIIFNSVVATIFLASCPAWAESPSPMVNFKGQYEFGFEGLMFGKAGFEVEQDASHYKITSDIKSAGIAKLFIKHSSHTTAEGTGKNGAYPAVVYETSYHTNKKAHYVKLTYAKGELVAEKLVPPETSGKRPPVPASMKADSVDLLTLVLKMRSELADAVKTGKPGFNIKAYDGRRLMEVNFTVGKKKQLRDGDEKTAVIAVNVRRKLLAGYTQSELDDYDPNEPTLTAYFTDDAKFIPIRFEIPMLIGMLSANLVKECSGNESCLLGITE